VSAPRAKIVVRILLDVVKSTDDLRLNVPQVGKLKTAFNNKPHCENTVGGELCDIMHQICSDVELKRDEL
jgi:hypothetical protein